MCNRKVYILTIYGYTMTNEEQEQIESAIDEAEYIHGREGERGL